MNNTSDFEKVLGKKNANVGEAIANSKAELGDNLKELLADVYNRFSEWINTGQIILEAFKNVKETLETIKEINDFVVELQKVTDEIVEEIQK